MRFCDIAGRPDRFTFAQVEEIARSHSGVVSFVIQGGRGVWVWDTAWPKVKDFSLLSP